MPHIKANHINIYYQVHEQHSSAETIVLVAGFSGDHTAWQSVIPEYAKDYQVVVFDNRGAGKSDCPNYPYTTEIMADDTAALVKELQQSGVIKNSAVHFIGHSFGGCIVQDLARRYPELIKSMTIANSFLSPNMRLILYGTTRLELIKAGAPQNSTIKFIAALCWSNNYLSRPGMVEQLVNIGFFPITIAGYEHQWHALATFDARSWVHEIKCPALIIACDEDLLANVEDAEHIAASIEGAQYFCFHKVGHVPQIEQPEAFNTLALEFITKQAPIN